jgi:restriction endonuclease S subunit
MDNLNTSILSQLPLPIPPLNEQHAIAVHLDHEIAKLDALTAKVQESIERLQEYRTALISAAVTGKIDVREARLETNWSEELERQASQEG